jgi:hypothetical protein
MSRLFQRILGLLAVVGCGIWIGRSSGDVEPYVTTIGAIAAFFALFTEKSGPSILLNIVRRHGREILYVRNIGDADAFDVEVKLGPPEECFFQSGWKEFDGGMKLDILHESQAITVDGYLFKEGEIGKVGHLFEWSWAAKKGGKRVSRRGRVSVETESLPPPPPPISSTVMDALTGRSRFR